MTMDTIKKYLSEMQLNQNGWTYRGRTQSFTTADRLSELTHFMYTEWYSKKDSFADKTITYPSGSDAGFVNLLSQYNNTVEKTETWTVTATYPSGVATIQRGKQLRSVHIRQILNTSGSTIVQNQQYNILFPKEDKDLQQGFYYVYSNEYFISEGAMFRAYWNISSDGAAPLIAAVTEVLNRYHIPFIFKCLNHPDLYYRRDSAVLYFDSRYLGLIRQLLAKISSEVRAYLQSDVPLFTFRHHDGVGIAENPETNESFGMHRMRLVAEALLNSTAQQTNDLTLSLSDTFASAGLDINHPYLNKGTANFLKYEHHDL